MSKKYYTSNYIILIRIVWSRVVKYWMCPTTRDLLERCGGGGGLSAPTSPLYTLVALRMTQPVKRSSQERKQVHIDKSM